MYDTQVSNHIMVVKYNKTTYKDIIDIIFFDNNNTTYNIYFLTFNAKLRNVGSKSNVFRLTNMSLFLRSCVFCVMSNDDNPIEFEGLASNCCVSIILTSVNEKNANKLATSDFYWYRLEVHYVSTFVKRLS